MLIYWLILSNQDFLWNNGRIKNGIWLINLFSLIASEVVKQQWTECN